MVNFDGGKKSGKKDQPCKSGQIDRRIFCLGKVLKLLIHNERVATPNDPKLSDGGAWRGSCVVERSEGIRATEKGGSK